MLESLVFLSVVGYLSWRFFAWRFFGKRRKKRWRSKSGAFKRAFSQYKPFQRDREFSAHDEFANKQVRRVFVTSCENIDYGVKKFVEENNVEYRVVGYKK